MKLLPILLQLPLWLLSVASLIAGIYAAIYSIQGITFFTPIILAIIIISYAIGRFLSYRIHKGEIKQCQA